VRISRKQAAAIAAEAGALRSLRSVGLHVAQLVPVAKGEASGGFAVRWADWAACDACRFAMSGFVGVVQSVRSRKAPQFIKKGLLFRTAR
jgi:hypothetical protein